MPVVPHAGGWGAQSWGGWGWGGPTTEILGFSVVEVYAPAENVVRILLTQLPYYSEIFDTYDASDPTHYTITAVAGSQGWDGNPIRAVNVVEVLISTAVPNALDVYLDRPMSAYPANYTLTATNIGTVGLSTTIASTGALPFLGVFRRLEPQLAEQAVPNRDIANPQTISAIQASGVGSTLGPSAALGVFNVDDSGDYAFDSGVQGVKKRVLRRGVTRTNGFAHLQGYGVGLVDAVKQLGDNNTRSRLAANYQAQILLEPEVIAASVTPLPDPSFPGLVHFLIAVRTRTGSSFAMDHPLDTIAGISLANINGVE
jgi:hypothetical protein